MSRSDAKRLRLLAVEALAIAGQMTDPTCKQFMFGIAQSYDRLADFAEAREPDKGPTEDKK
jgi:hypothetical protein